MDTIQLDINGRSYDALDVAIFALNNKVNGVRSAGYGYTRDHQNNYVVGSDEPYNYSMGPKQYEEGQFTLMMEEVVAIENASGMNAKKDITKIKPFKTYFTYLNDANQVVTDEVTWKFKNWGREVNIDNMGMARDFTMHIISIRPNIV